MAGSGLLAVENRQQWQRECGTEWGLIHEHKLVQVQQESAGFGEAVEGGEVLKLLEFFGLGLSAGRELEGESGLVCGGWGLLLDACGKVLGHDEVEAIIEE